MQKGLFSAIWRITILRGIQQNKQCRPASRAFIFCFQSDPKALQLSPASQSKNAPFGALFVL
jgi:hypothetical protein